MLLVLEMEEGMAGCGGGSAGVSGLDLDIDV